MICSYIITYYLSWSVDAKVTKVYFWGGMAEYRRCVKNILQVYEGIIACAEISHPMYAPDGLDSCNFCNEGIRFFSRTAPIILPDSFEFYGVEQNSTK